MRNYIAFALILCMIAMPAHAQKRKEAIAATVGTQAITLSDVNDRMKLVMASAGMPDNPDIIAKVRPQILSALIEETVKNQEAARLKVKADEKDIDAAIAEIAQQNKLSADKFTGMLRAHNISVATLRNQIRSQIGWMKVVARQIRPQVDVSESDIDAELSLLQSKIGQEEYLVSEIVLPSDRPQDEANIRALSARIIDQIKAQPQTFPALARQFSKAAGAQAGGDIGWVSPTQLPDEIARELEGTKPGSIVGPVKAPSGVTILMVRDKRTRSADKMPSRDEIAQRIGLERMERLSQHYYRDLRSSAFVDIRG